MKTAVSLPEELFEAAEREARRTSKSRSKLYAAALTEYLARHAPDELTEAMNRVIDELGEPDTRPFLDRAARQLLQRVEW